MAIPISPPRFVLLLAIGALAACSPPEDHIPSADTDAARQFSAEDRRAAQALSIGNQAQLTGAATAYDRAVLCSLALSSLTEQLEERGILDATQRRALAEARALFDRRLRREAGARSAEQITLDRDQAATNTPEPSTRAQVAIGCLRRLQQDQGA